MAKPLKFEDSSPLQPILAILATWATLGSTGVTLDKVADGLLKLHKCEPAFLGYKGYPNTICVSVNNEVIHGIPTDKKFEDGDVVKIDLGLKKDGQYDDGACTVIIGRGSAAARRLVKTTQAALEAGIRQAKAGNTTNDIAEAIQAVVEREKFALIEGYGGHGIGDELHLDPHIPNIVHDKPVTLTKGMRIAIEPMVSTLRGQTEVMKNGWTVKLVGGGIAAHFERTVTI
jgi:methionyl aminopeptidase